MQEHLKIFKLKSRYLVFIIIVFFSQEVLSQNLSPFRDSSDATIVPKITGTVGDFRAASGSNARFHGGVDFVNTYFTENIVRNRAVYSMHTGKVVDIKKSPLVNFWNTYIKIMLDNGEYVYYKHIEPSNINPINNQVSNIAINSNVDVGTFLGLMRTDGPVHLHVNDNSSSSGTLQGNTNFINNFINPFSDLKSPDFLNPFHSGESVINETSSLESLEFHKNGHTYNSNLDNIIDIHTNLNNILHKVVFNKVDVVSRVRDRHVLPSGNGSSYGNNGINKIGLELYNSDGAKIDSLKNISFSNVPDNSIANFIYDARSVISDTSRHVYIVTGSITEPYDRFLNLRLKTNLIENYDLSTSDEKDSKINSQCKFQDGVYSIKLIAEDIKNELGTLTNTKEKDTPIVIDNFLPYIKKVTLSDTGGVFYMGEWNLNSMETALEFQYCSTGVTTRQGFDIEVETSETMNSLSLELEGNTYSLLSFDNSKTIWGLSIATTFDNGEHTLNFTGTDLAENQLRQMQGDTANLYYRTGDNTWHSETTGNDTSNPLLGTDTRHTFNTPEYTGVNCGNSIDCNSDPLETTGNYLLPNNDSNNVLTLNDDYELLTKHAYLCEVNDIDRYDFEVHDKGTLKIFLSNLSQNFELELYKNGNYVAGSYNSSNQPEKIEYEVDTWIDATYTLVVYGNGYQSGNGLNSNTPYKFAVNWFPDNTSLWDLFLAHVAEAAPITTFNVCEGEQIQLSVSVPSECQNNVDYLWYPSTGLSCDDCPNPTVTGIDNITYNLYIIPKEDDLYDNYNCYYEIDVHISVAPSPTANAGQDQNITSGQSVQLQGYGASVVSWLPTTGLDNPNVWNPAATPSQTTTYTLTVTENGCTDTDTVTIYVDETGGGNPPANDNCSNAEILTSHTYQSFTNGTIEDATQSDLGANQCSGSGQTSQDDYDVFYKFTAVSTSHTITIKDLAYNFDGVIEIRSGCSSGTNIMCYDPSGLQSPISLTYDNFTPNQTYYIRIFEYNYISSPPSSNTFKICVTHEGGNTNDPPENDNCSNAETLISHTYESFIGGTVSDATESVGANDCFGCGGCRSEDDFDVYYKFTAVESSHTIHLDNYASNFDAVIELRTSCQSGSSNYISCYDPTGTPSSIDRTWSGLTPNETYYIRVFEFDYVDSPPSTDTFDICVTHTDTSGNIDLVSEIDSVSDANPDAGDTIDVTIKVTNQGDVDLNEQTLIALYLSSDEDYQPAWDDFLLGDNIYSLDAGETTYVYLTITLDNNLFSRWYYLISNADHGNAISESDEDNNLDSYPIHIGEIEAPDIEIRDITVTPNSNLAPGQEINVEFELENDGNDDCNGFENLIVFDRNNNGIYDAGDDIIGNRSFNGLDEGERHTRDWDCNLPINIPSIGTYRILIIADSDDDINESDEDDNVDYATIYISTITPAGPDLIPHFLGVEIDEGNIPVSEFNLCLEEKYTFRFSIENIGNLPSSTGGSSLRTELYISKDEILDGYDKFIGSANMGGSVYIGEINTASESEILRGFDSGNYYLIIIVDEEEILDEISEENNKIAIPIAINNCNNLVLPDLDVDIVSYTPYSSELGDYITVEMEIKNIGNTDITDFDIDLFISEDQIFHGRGGSDSAIIDNRLLDDGHDTYHEILSPNQTITYTMTAYINGNDTQINSTGIYYIFACLDERREFNEYNKNNNLDYVPIELTSLECYYHTSEETLTVPYNQGIIYLFYVNSENSCNYIVDGVEDWISFPNNFNLSGRSDIYVSMDNNPYPYPRIGHITYEDNVFEFTQEARPCELLADDIKMSIGSSNIIPIECDGFGSIDISIQNGFPPYTFSWSNGETTEDLLEINNSGDYTVTVTDYYGCTFEETITIGFADDVDISNISASSFTYSYSNRDECTMGNLVVESSEVVECRDFILKIFDATGTLIEEKLFTESITQELVAGSYNACILIQGFNSNEFEYCFNIDIVDNTDISNINDNTFTTEVVGFMGCENGSITINASESIDCHDYKISIYQGLTNIIDNETFTNTYYIDNLPLSSYDIYITLEGFSTDEFHFQDIIIIEDETDLSSIGENTFNTEVIGAIGCVSTGSFSINPLAFIDCHDYSITINNSTGNAIISNQILTEELTLDNLPLDNYNVCITVNFENIPISEFEYCFDFNIVDETDISFVNDNTFHTDITNVVNCVDTGNIYLSALDIIDCHDYNIIVTNSTGNTVITDSFTDNLMIENLDVDDYTACITIENIPTETFEYCFDFSIIDETDVSHITKEDFKTKVYGNFEDGNGYFKIQSFDGVDCHKFNLSIEDENGNSIYNQNSNYLSAFIDDLDNGNYTACITIENISTDVFEYCYTISIKEDDATVKAYLDCEDNSKNIRFNLSNYDEPSYIEIRNINDNYDLWNGYKEGVSIHHFNSYANNEHIEFSAVICDSEYGSTFIDYYRTVLKSVPEFNPEFSLNRFDLTINTGAYGGISPYRVSVQNDQGYYYEEFFDEFSDIEFNLLEGLNHIIISDFVGCNNDLVKEILIKSDEYLLFPNPTNDYLNVFIPISILSNKVHLDIFDTTGKKILTYSFDLNSNLAIINVSTLPTGTYIINIYSDGEGSFWSRKFIKR